jgi:preprotein translocase subunit SecY
MNYILQIFRRPDLRKKVLFILALMAIAQFTHNIPIPAVDASRLRDFLSQNQLFGLVSTFTGGSLSTLSIAMLGLAPYITASIIMQLSHDIPVAGADVQV